MAAANTTCKLTLLIKTTLKGGYQQDYEHSVIITQDEALIKALKKEEQKYWEGGGGNNNNSENNNSENNYSEENNNSEGNNEVPLVEISEKPITVDKDASSIYVVFHYHDNYADSINTFETKEEAFEFYKEEISTMSNDLRDGYFVKSKKLNETTYMSTLYDEDGNYPDKGDRWVFTKVDFKSCSGKVGGTRRRKYKKAKKTRKYKRV
jgi:hypothetical protein